MEMMDRINMLLEAYANTSVKNIKLASSNHTLLAVGNAEIEIGSYIMDDGTLLYGQADSYYIVDEIWNKKCYYHGPELNKETTVIDVGANQGFYSVYAAKYCKSVIAIEPDPINFAIMRKNIEVNNLEDRVTLVNAAVGCSQHPTLLFKPVSNTDAVSGMISTNKEYLASIGLAAELTSFEAPTITLYDLIGKNVGPLFLKLDCEGSELDVLKSIGPAVQYVNALTMETHGCYTDAEICAYVKAIGLRIVNFTPMTSKYMVGFLNAVSS